MTDNNNNSLNKLYDLEKDKIVIPLLEFLNKYLNPAFATLPKREVDLLVFDLMKKLQIINENPEVYDLVKILRISTSKARNLIYDSEIRISDDNQLKQRVRKILEEPIVQKDVDKVLLQIDNPVMMDYIKNQVKLLHHLSDGSFSPTIIKLSTSTFSELFYAVMSHDEKQKLEEILKKNGLEDQNNSKFISTIIKAAAQNLLPGFGGAAAAAAIDYLSPILSSNYAELEKSVKKLLPIFQSEKNSHLQ